MYLVFGAFFFQAEDGIRDLVRSRGLGDVYKRQVRSTTGAAILMVSHDLHVVMAASDRVICLNGHILSLIHI